jgi:tRNA(Ile)-lysidine synthase
LDLPRNRVRNELLPLLRQHYQPALTRTILRLMEIVGAESEVVGNLASQWLKEAGRDGPPGRPRTPQRVAPAFEKLPLAVQRRALQLQLTKLGVWADFELVERLRRAPDVLVGISPGLSVIRDEAGTVSLRAQAAVKFKVNELTINLADRGGEVDFDGVRFRWGHENAKSGTRLGKTPSCEVFDADKVGSRITLRHWRAGDRFQPSGLKWAVKLQDLFTNQKIPRDQRHGLVVAEAADGRLFWVQNLRISEPFKLTAATKHHLVWRWRCTSR